MNKIIVTSILIILSLGLTSGCSNQAQVNTSMVMINEDGTETPVEEIQWEGKLTAEEIIALEDEMMLLLEEQDYINTAIVTLYYQEGESEKPCVLVNVHGEAVGDHVDELSALIVGRLGSCDWENSVIADTEGGIWPLK